MFNFFKNLSSTEIIVIVLILVVIFGGKVAKKFGRIGGESLKEIKNIKKSVTETVEDDKADKK